MPDPNRTFLSKVAGPRARFYLADFHVHSPGSIDFVGADGKQLNLHSSPLEHEERALSEFPVQSYYDALVSHRDTVFKNTCSPDQDNSAVVAITDHNVCRYACALAKHALQGDCFRANRLLVLPGMELTVTFPVDSPLETATAHILLAFSPSVEDRQIYAVIRECSGVNWELGRPISVAALPEFVDSLRNHSNFPAVVIAAHVNSAKGVQKEVRKTILTRLDAAIMHMEAAIDCADEVDKTVLQRDLERLKQRRSDNDGISLEVLRLLGLCGFDAIQIAAKEEQHHYRRLHRCRREMGRAVPIICSDAHRVEDVFHTRRTDESSHHPFIKLPTAPNVSGLDGILGQVRDRSLRYGETRFSCVPPGQVTAWIEALEIVPDSKDAANFWPLAASGDSGSGGFTLHFSQNLNCVIGGRGSGKSAALEAIAFATVPSAFSDKDARKQDWYKRAASTLRGCRLRACWRILNAPQLGLKKNALFVSRYFDPLHNHSRAILTNIDEKELAPEAWQSLDVEFFRLHDIESAAQPEKLRSLFDRFCGDRIRQLQLEIAAIKGKLASQREEMLKVARRLADLTANHSPLREYARRRHAYNEANREDIREQFQDLDNVEEAETLARNAENDWREIVEDFGLDGQGQRVAGFFDNLKQRVGGPFVSEAGGAESPKIVETKVDQGKVNRYLQALAPLLPDAQPSLATAVEKGIKELAKSVDDVTAAIVNARDNLVESHRNSRESLAAKGFPKGAADRQTKKKAIDEAEECLNEYRVRIKEWNELSEVRKELFSSLEEKCKERTTLRRLTADRITSQLEKDLDQRVLRIEADAQPLNDTTEFAAWLDKEIDWNAYRFKAERVNALCNENRLLPSELRNALLNDGEQDLSRFVVNKPRAQDGRITKQEAADILAAMRPCATLPSEVVGAGYDDAFVNSLPAEIREGLKVFRFKADGVSLLIEPVLRLDEIVLDDQPIVRFNDRPQETKVMKPLDRLSQGQRCSAILPILLLTGTSPLIIDQPEDNLDNRLIRQVIVNVLASIKLRRQVIVATHNPNLPVLGDAEQVIALRAVEDDRCSVEAVGSLDDEEIVHQITEIMEGGREAFQYRQSIYEVQWTGGAASR